MTQAINWTRQERAEMPTFRHRHLHLIGRDRLGSYLPAWQTNKQTNNEAKLHSQKNVHVSILSKMANMGTDRPLAPMAGKGGMPGRNQHPTARRLDHLVAPCKGLSDTG